MEQKNWSTDRDDHMKKNQLRLIDRRVCRWEWFSVWLSDNLTQWVSNRIHAIPAVCHIFVVVEKTLYLTCICLITRLTLKKKREQPRRVERMGFMMCTHCPGQARPGFHSTKRFGPKKTHALSLESSHAVPIEFHGQSGPRSSTTSVVHDDPTMQPPSWTTTDVKEEAKKFDDDPMTQPPSGVSGRRINGGEAANGIWRRQVCLLWP